MTSLAPNELPEPPIQADADLRGLPWMKLPVSDLLEAEAWAGASVHEQIARINLMHAAWKAVPAGSLPQDEKLLRIFSKSGSRWPAVRDFALDGFQLHSDNRLYHPILTPLVDASWKAVKSNRQRQAVFRAKKSGDGSGTFPRYVTVTGHVTQRTQDIREEILSKKRQGINDASLPAEVPWGPRVRSYRADLLAGKKPFWIPATMGPPPDNPLTWVPRQILMQYGFLE